jgi:hypothetical protein
MVKASLLSYVHAFNEKPKKLVEKNDEILLSFLM